jgi:hypothetical protein
MKYLILIGITFTAIYLLDKTEINDFAQGWLSATVYYISLMIYDEVKK